LPTLVIQYGIPVERVSSATAAFSAGMVIGGLVLAFVSTVIPAPRIILVLTAAAGVTLAIIGSLGMPAGVLLALIAVAGIGASSGTMGQAAMAVTLYGEHQRTV
ncbi:hypothetical protein, partial [Polaribacter sargassicola]|uniref:hypothetical protein n=1 Tax=Polaribacter sargassicola TaxID=2836891 RepID=UPI001F3DF0C7